VAVPNLNISDCLKDYFSSEYRSKLLFLRKVAYGVLREDIFWFYGENSKSFF